MGEVWTETSFDTLTPEFNFINPNGSHFWFLESAFSFIIKIKMGNTSTSLLLSQVSQQATRGSYQKRQNPQTPIRNRRPNEKSRYRQSSELLT